MHPEDRAMLAGIGFFILYAGLELFGYTTLSLAPLMISLVLCVYGVISG